MEPSITAHNVIIRTANIDDIDKILFLEEQVYELHLKERHDLIDSRKKLNNYSYLKDTIRSESSKIFIIENDNKIIGHCIMNIIEIKNHPMFFDIKKIEIDDLCIDEQYRRKGAGKRLFEAVKLFSKEISAQFIELSVWEFNQNAISFYESMGMKTRTRRMEFFVG